MASKDSKAEDELILLAVDRDEDHALRDLLFGSQ